MNSPTSALLAPFATSGSFTDATREPWWDVFLFLTMLVAGFVFRMSWRYGRQKLGLDIPFPGQTLETTARMERAGAQIGVVVVLVVGLLFIATGIWLTQIFEFVMGAVAIAWSLVALRSLKRPASDAPGGQP